MRIDCPVCGPRDVGEFQYDGDGTICRPDLGEQDVTVWNSYVYDRANPVGQHREIWQHVHGCRSHLLVVRDTVTHQISAVQRVKPGAGVPGESAMGDRGRS